MRKLLLCAAIVFACASMGKAFADDATLSDAEVKDLLKLVDETQANLMARISGMTDAQWNFKQNEKRWSVGECVQHIALAERGILEGVQQALAGPADPEWATKSKGKLDIVKTAVPNRGPQGQGGFQAPEPLQPVNKWDRAKTIEEFYAAHGHLRAFIETMDRAHIKDHGMPHPVPQLGWMNGYDWLNLILYHTVRHTKQAIEVQEDANYPKAAAATGGR